MSQLDKLKTNSDRPLIIFGASKIGEMTYHACKSNGLEVTCFADDKRKGTLHGLDIVHTNDLRERYGTAAFLIGSANIQDMVERLNDLGYSEWYPCGVVLNYFDVTPDHCLNEGRLEQDYLDYLVTSCILAQESYVNPNRLFTKNIDLMITEKCSMSCIDCSNLMPYYEKPRNYTLDMLMHSIDALCNYFDEIFEVRVIGGEPLMNKDFHKIVGRLTQEPKIKKVAIFTNGTIVPNDQQMESLKHEKLFFYITDYGDLSRNLGKLVEKLRNNNIFHYTHKATGWTSCSSLEKHNRSPDENIDLFKKCCATNLATVAESKLFRCPFAANAYQLGGIPNDPDDYVDIQNLQDSAIDAQAASQLIKTFLFEKDCIPACDYCAGRSYGDPEITPAVQIKTKRPYKKYEMK